MAHTQLELTSDELLSTTRAVRKRLDFDRPIDDDTLKECLQIATQAPTGSNAQGWQFMFVRDAAKKQKLAEYYLDTWNFYKTQPYAIHALHKNSGTAQEESQERSTSSAQYLADNMAKAPVLMIPCIAGRTDAPEGLPTMAQASLFGSIIPAAWSFMLAARSRGIGSAWTTLHLMNEKAIAEILGIPFDEYMQVAMIPLAYTKGTNFKPAYRPPVETIMHIDSW